MLMPEAEVKRLIVKICTNFTAKYSGITIQDDVPDYLADVPRRYINDDGSIDIDTDQLDLAVAGLLYYVSHTSGITVTGAGITVGIIQQAMAEPESHRYHYLWLGEQS